MRVGVHSSMTLNDPPTLTSYSPSPASWLYPPSAAPSFCLCLPVSLSLPAYVSLLLSFLTVSLCRHPSLPVSLLPSLPPSLHVCLFFSPLPSLSLPPSLPPSIPVSLPPGCVGQRGLSLVDGVGIVHRARAEDRSAPERGIHLHTLLQLESWGCSSERWSASSAKNCSGASNPSTTNSRVDCAHLRPLV